MQNESKTVVISDDRSQDSATKDAGAKAASLRLLIGIALHNAGYRVLNHAKTPDVLLSPAEDVVVVSSAAVTIELSRPFTRAQLIEAVERAISSGDAEGRPPEAPPRSDI